MSGTKLLALRAGMQFNIEETEEIHTEEHGAFAFVKR
jgi:hypothetical protein